MLATKIVLLVLLTAALPMAAQDAASVERLLDGIIEKERQFLQSISSRTPLLETYIQETPGGEADARGMRDHYFLGRLSLAGGINYTPIAARSDATKSSRWQRLLKNRSVTFLPAGFGQMIFIDAGRFDRRDYNLEYVRREFIGEVRCIVFDVKPVEAKAEGRFIGRIWVEDRELQIVRFNGTYTGRDKSRLYFHFDSWRVNVGPGQWVPSCVYVEESGQNAGAAGPRFKAQTRLWGYNTGRSGRMDELTNILVEMRGPVQDKDASADVSPLESQRSWERQAEENIIDRLEKSGLLAPKGDVDNILNTVVNNLIVTSNLNVDAQCRVLMTTPLESFTVGRTIVISRGLLDVLPDEASLAMVLADELAHVALGHRTATQFAFTNQTMFSDEDLLQRFRFSRTAEEIGAASAKAVQMLRASPYSSKLSNAGLFLKALASRALQFPNLIRANIGNQLASGETVVRMGELANQAPQLEEERLEQIAALPLGSRIKVDPWANTIAMMKAKPVSLLSAREKLSFEVTPFMVHLTRVSGEGRP
jgi:hypothetical protein